MAEDKRQNDFTKCVTSPEDTGKYGGADVDDLIADLNQALSV